MTFQDDIVSDQATMLADWGEAFSVALNGLTVDSVSGIFDEAVETISPHDANVIVIRPALSIASARFAGFGKDYSFTHDQTGATYKIFGDPQPDGHGLTRLYLVKA